MRRLLHKVSAVLGGSALLLLLPLAGTSLAAGKTVLVLPFAVDSGVKMPDAAKKIPQDRLLVESDCTPENAADCPPADAVAAKLAEVRGEPLEELLARLDDNADRFLSL